jgi:hypothetical protein
MTAGSARKIPRLASCSGKRSFRRDSGQSHNSYGRDGKQHVVAHVGDMVVASPLP